MGWFKKNKEVEAVIEAPKPTHYDCLMEVVVRNNRTDSELTFSSINDFGLSVFFHQINKSVYIDQRDKIYGGENGGNITYVARLSDWSVVKLSYKKIQINN